MVSPITISLNNLGINCYSKLERGSKWINN